MRARLVVGLLLAACFSESDQSQATGDSSSGSESTTTTSATTSSTTASSITTSTTADTGDVTTDSGGCGEKEVPAPPVPAEWEGPFMLMPAMPDAMMPPDCPPELVPSAMQIVKGGPHGGCECSCDLACVVDFYGDPGCVTAVGASVSVTANCTMGGAYHGLYTGLSDPNECMEPEFGPKLPTQWDDTMRVCAADQDAACLPFPIGAIGPCIRSAGQRDCMLDELSLRIVVGTDATFECDPCPSCVMQADTQCGAASVGVYDGNSCSSMSETLGVADCSMTPASQLQLVGGVVQQCADATALPTLVDAQTFCCAAS
jgi:hypothetical protein